MDLDQVSKQLREFVDAKGWNSPESARPQTPRNLAISLSLEAGELLEHFQWNEEGDKTAIAAELADVVLYSIRLADVLGIDLSTALRDKMNINLHRTWR